MKETSFTRVNRSTATARVFYNRISGFYDQLAASSERRYTTAGLHKLAAEQGQNILEIGFGTGQALVALARAVGDHGHIYGLDVSEGMYRVARRRIQQAGLANRVVSSWRHEFALAASALRCSITSFTLELLTRRRSRRYSPSAEGS
jgi:demethylmenaquinone methyltransferase/2-methoxy-6-polyprenyl-1,4-benzoquinol methylase